MSAPAARLNIILAERPAPTNPHPAGERSHLASAFTRASSTGGKAHWRNASATPPLSFAEEVVPATLTYRRPVVECPVRVAEKGGSPMPIRTALPVSGTSAGQAVVVVLGGPDCTAGAMLVWAGFIWKS